MKTIKEILFSKIISTFKSPNIRFSLISVLIIISISTVLLSINIIGTTYDYSIGDIVRDDIKIPRDIHYVNESETKMERKREAESVPIVFDRDASILREKLNIVGALTNNAANTMKQYPPTGKDLSFQIYAMKSVSPKYLHYNDTILAELLRYKNTLKLKKAIFRILIYIYDDPGMGILASPYGNSLNIDNTNVTVRTINSPETVDETSRALKSLITIDDIKNRLYAICYSIAPYLPKNTLIAVTQIVRSNLQPNLTFNIEESKRRINEIIKQVKPVMGILKKGQTIIREGDTITSEIMNRIEIYNKETTSSHIGYIFGILLIQIIFLFIFGYFFIDFSRLFIPDKKSIAIIFTLIIIFMVYTFFISRTEISTESKLIFVLLLPIPFTTMIVSILYNTYLSMIVGVYILFFTALIGGGDITTMVIAFGAALSGVFVNKNVEKRTDFLRGGFIIGLINSTLIITVALMQEIPILNALKVLHIAFANGIINSILVLGILPLYENIFGITTKFKLLELSDLNAEIFKEMLVKAPGTYNHSLIVSTMAEAACKEINANHLLARVGSYYHDIGKIADSGMYIENSVTDPRAKIMSSKAYAKLIISHVEKGVKIAEENSLPEAVIDFIREHHGKTTMTFFYHQSLENADSSSEHEEIDKSDFQYSGPKPHSKETAVVMLADVIEAATRSLQNPSYEILEGLSRKMIYNKLNEGELDFSDLSMSELSSIQQAFFKILSGLFHTRIEYPESHDIKKLEDKLKKNNGTD